jgi:hypothetical protein
VQWKERWFVGSRIMTTETETLCPNKIGLP